MNKMFRGFTAILYKEFISVLRDPFTLFFMFFPPIVEMIAFGYALDTDVKHMATLVLDEDRTTESRQLIDQFVNTQTFRVVGEVHSVAELSDYQRAPTAGITRCEQRVADDHNETVGALDSLQRVGESLFRFFCWRAGQSMN